MPLTLGEQLQETRLKRGISLEDAAKATHIRAVHLLSLEEDRLEDLPSLTQARGFIRLYADYLGLDAHALVAQLGKPDQPEALPPEAEKEAPGSKPESDEPPPADEPPVSSSPEDHDPARAIFVEIGNALREQREKLSLAIEDISAHTKIRRNYIHILESGNFDELPSPMQARGLLNNYANFLSLDADPLLNQFATALQARRESREAESSDKPSKKTGVHKPRAAGLRNFLTIDLMIGVFLILVLFGFIIWGASELLNARVATLTPNAPPISEVLMASPGVESTQQPVSEQPTETSTSEATLELPLQETSIASSQSPVVASTGRFQLQLNISVNQPAYLKVIADGKQVFNGRVVSGNAYQYSANTSIELLTGNAAALSVIFNQSDLGVMGTMGQPLHYVFTLQGFFTPTPAFTSTATITPPATLTPRATPTVPTPTVTPLIPTPKP